MIMMIYLKIYVKKKRTNRNISSASAIMECEEECKTVKKEIQKDKKNKDYGSLKTILSCQSIDGKWEMKK